jgi:hypothetical protein
MKLGRALLRTVVSTLSLSLVVGALAVTVTAPAGCGGPCSSSEEQSCTSTYNTCIQNAAATASLAACQACVDDYCSCFDSCGSDCDSAALSGACAGMQ